MKDYYRILEIHPEASPEVLNKAYRTLVHKYHPDRYHSSDKTAMNRRLQEINEAYETLSSQSARRDYDARYREAMARGGLHRPPSESGGQRLKKLLLWAGGTFIVLQFLLRPLLASPVMRVLLLAGLVFLLVRLYGRPSQRS